MNSSRIEAFSDGVIAILITIMVLDLKVPHDPSFSSLGLMGPVFLSYVLSFVYLGIYWNNHHHLFQTVRNVKGSLLWANLFLLFTLSLVPFATSWMGVNHFAATPVAFYGIILFSAAFAYFLLQHSIVQTDGKRSLLKTALGSDWKGKLSPILYLIAIVFAFFATWVSGLIYIAVALLWLVPDPRIEKVIEETQGDPEALPPASQPSAP